MGMLDLLAFDFVFLILLWWTEFCVGCEGSTHLWEGREALGEGHKLGSSLQLRKLSHDEDLFISWSMGSITAMNLVILGGTKRFM